MAMGIVSDSEFNKEKEKLIPSTPSTKSTPSVNEKVHEGEVVDISRGRGKGSVEVPNTLRNLIGITTVNEGRQDALELAKQFGISPSSTSAYGVGATSTASYDKTPNAPVLDKVKVKIQNKAKRKLMLALNHMTPDKLEGTKARDLAGIAKDMSAIVRNMEPEKETGAAGDTKEPFVVYSPMVHTENHYEVLVVKE